MGKILSLREAINLIWETVEIGREMESGCPYLFIVGAGISAPEILTANGIIDQCKKKVEQLCQGDEEKLQRICDTAERLGENSAKYYSYWFEQAYKNKIHRQQYLKSIMNNSRISMSNLLLAQILNIKTIATTAITPNFDNHLLKSLNLLGNYDVFSANNMLDNIALNANSKTVQIMHVHGTYEFYDCCNLESEIAKIASETVQEYDMEEIQNCRGCLDYAHLVITVVCERLKLKEHVDRKYIEYAIQLCEKEGGCPLIVKNVVRMLQIYVAHVENLYEKQEICKKATRVCEKSKLYEEWIYFNESYVSELDQREYEKYLEEHEKYREYKQAADKIHEAVEAYIHLEKDVCKDLLFEASECFDQIFEGKYNPALLNICFVARRGEGSELNISVLDVLERIDWMMGDAIYHINKALTLVEQGDWGNAQCEIRKIEENLDGAIEWWNREEVVGKREKALVFLLLSLEDKLRENMISSEKLEEMNVFAIENIDLPAHVKEKIDV